jgi:hypothetical protein
MGAPQHATERQVGLLAARFTGLYGDRELRLRAAAAVLGRSEPLGSFRELTSDEARRLFGWLRGVERGETDPDEMIAEGVHPGTPGGRPRAPGPTGDGGAGGQDIAPGTSEDELAGALVVALMFSTAGAVALLVGLRALWRLVGRRRREGPDGIARPSCAESRDGAFWEVLELPADRLGPWTTDRRTGALLAHWTIDANGRLIHLSRDPRTHRVRRVALDPDAGTGAQPACLRCRWLDEAVRRGVAESMLVDDAAIAHLMVQAP